MQPATTVHVMEFASRLVKLSANSCEIVPPSCATQRSAKTPSLIPEIPPRVLFFRPFRPSVRFSTAFCPKRELRRGWQSIARREHTGDIVAEICARESMFYREESDRAKAPPSPRAVLYPKIYLEMPAESPPESSSFLTNGLVAR